jgi:hypothetical protein
MPEFSVGDPEGSLCIVIQESSEVIPEEFSIFYEENYGGALNHTYTAEPVNIGFNAATGLFTCNCARAVFNIIPQFVVTRSESAGSVTLTVKRSGVTVHTQDFYVPLQEETLIGNPFGLVVNTGQTLEFLVSTPDLTYVTVVEGSVLTMYKHASGTAATYST